MRTTRAATNGQAASKGQSATKDQAASKDKAASKGKAAGIVLFPSAGTDASFSAMVAIDERISRGDPGLPVRRVDFPYRLAGRRIPDRTPVMVNAVVEATTAMAKSLKVGTDRILVGGRSMGGRMASYAVAEGLTVAGLILVAYPLHPPGHFNENRDDHFPAITVPTLFVSGAHDAFASTEELTESASKIRGRVAMKFVEGNRRTGGHALYGQDEQVAALVAAWVRRR